jgi:hypothetical protein
MAVQRRQVELMQVHEGGSPMAYNETLAQRIREALGSREGIEEKKMFGGLAFMLGGNMICGVTHDDLMARVGAENHEEALSLRGARPMDFAGRPMKGMVFVGPDRYSSDNDLLDWVDRVLAFGTTLPPKEAKTRAPRKPAAK